MEVAKSLVDSVRPSSLSRGTNPFKLSLIDQLTPPTYTPLILFYPMSDPSWKRTSQVSNQLKWSLSKTLKEFHPLSGRLMDNHIIHDFHEGVLYTETRVHGQLSDFLAKPQLQGLNGFLPCHSSCLEVDPNVPQVSIQLNIFDCGGLALGMSFLHKLIDGVTLKCFLHTWAAISRGSTNGIMLPNLHQASSLFPPQHPFPPPCTWLVNSLWFGSSEKKHSRRRFVFSDDAVDALRAKARSSQVEYPTRAEAVQALLLKSAMEASRSVSNHPKPTLLTQKVNIRSRTSPRLHKHSIGNLVYSGMSYYSPTGLPIVIKHVVKSLMGYYENSDDKEKKLQLDWLVALGRDGVAKIDDKYVKNIMGDNGLVRITKNLSLITMFLKATDPDIHRFTTWIKFGYDDVDYGWGAPVWSALHGELSPDSPCNCLVNTFKDYKPEKRAIEAWVTLEEKVMDLVEQDEEFLQFTSRNPSIIMP